jgi:hypothetical protein
MSVRWLDEAAASRSFLAVTCAHRYAWGCAGMPEELFVTLMIVGAAGYFIAY